MYQGPNKDPMLTRSLTTECSSTASGYVVQVTQVDALPRATEAKYRIQLVGVFGRDLVLRSIHVTDQQGSRGDLCQMARNSLNDLVGERVGHGFREAIRRACKCCSCMHYPAMLEQMSTAAYRAQSVELFEREGRDAFLRENQLRFSGRCVGYSAPPEDSYAEAGLEARADCQVAQDDPARGSAVL
jgi:hypothetical protein